MASFVLVPGAGGMAWYWHRVVPIIRAAGHEPIAVDLPGDDRHAGLAAYVDIVICAIAERSDVILVAQSLAGFTAPLVCARAPVRMVVFVNAMIPTPGETAGAWWGPTGAAEAREQAAERRGYATDAKIKSFAFTNACAAGNSPIRRRPTSERDLLRAGGMPMIPPIGAGGMLLGIGALAECCTSGNEKPQLQEGQRAPRLSGDRQCVWRAINREAK